MISKNPNAFQSTPEKIIIADIASHINHTLTKPQILKLIKYFGPEPNVNISHVHMSLTQVIDLHNWNLQELLQLSVLHISPRLLQKIEKNVMLAIQAPEKQDWLVSSLSDFIVNNRIEWNFVWEWLINQHEDLTVGQLEKLLQIAPIDSNKKLFEFLEFFLEKKNQFSDKMIEFAILKYLNYEQNQKKKISYKKIDNEGQKSFRNLEEDLEEESEEEVNEDETHSQDESFFTKKNLSKTDQNEIIEQIQKIILERVAQDKFFNRKVKGENGETVDMYPAIHEMDQNYFWSQISNIRENLDIKRQRPSELTHLIEDQIQERQVFSPYLPFYFPDVFEQIIYRALIIRVMGQKLIQKGLLRAEIVHYIETVLLDQLEGYFKYLENYKIKELAKLTGMRISKKSFHFKRFRSFNMIFLHGRPYIYHSKWDWIQTPIKCSKYYIKKKNEIEEGYISRNNAGNEDHDWEMLYNQGDRLQFDHIHNQEWMDYDEKPVFVEYKKTLRSPYADGFVNLIGMREAIRIVYFDEMHVDGN